MPGEFKEGQKQRKALALLADKPVMSVQVLSETANIMRRKLGLDATAKRHWVKADF